MTRDEALRILGLESNATLEDAKKAHRDLVKVIHPDKDSSPGAKQRFILVQDAYEVITNQQKQGEPARSEKVRWYRERKVGRKENAKNEKGGNTSGKKYRTATPAIAKHITVSASVDRNIVGVHGRILLSVNIEGVQEDFQKLAKQYKQLDTTLKAPNLPVIDGFQAKYQGPFTDISIVKWQMSVCLKHRYLLMALKPGKYTINPILVKYKGKNYRTNPIAVEITQNSTPEGQNDEFDDAFWKNGL